MNTFFALARAVHFGACLLLLGLPLFDRLIIAPLDPSLRDTADRNWKPIAMTLLLLAAIGALISGVAWLGFIAIEMSGLPLRQALSRETLGLVWSQTHFGRLWQLRAFFWLVASTLTIPPAIAQFSRGRLAVSGRPDQTIARATLTAIGTVAGIGLIGSLAWAGHGQTGPRVALHLPADVVHLLVCAAWPVGLLPFSLVLLRLRRSPAPVAGESIVAMTRRFSAVSLISFTLLGGSGLINTWSLVGPIGNLWRSDYGRLLSFKIVLFILMFMIGSRNLLHLKPRLATDRAAGRKGTAARKLQRNVLMELLLAFIILLVVGYLGLMMPTYHEHHMHPTPHAADSATP